MKNNNLIRKIIDIDFNFKPWEFCLMLTSLVFKYLFLLLVIMLSFSPHKDYTIEKIVCFIIYLIFEFIYDICYKIAVFEYIDSKFEFMLEFVPFVHSFLFFISIFVRIFGFIQEKFNGINIKYNEIYQADIKADFKNIIKYQDIIESEFEKAGIKKY